MKATQIRLREMHEKLRLIENDKLRQIEGRLEELKQELDIKERNNFNLMNIFGIETRELSHSKFLMWLLNPNGTHGLGNEFLSRFVKLVTNRSKKESVADSIQYNKLIIERENVGDKSRLDIKIYDRSKTFLCVLENKIESGEGTDQTSRLYHDNHDVSVANEFFVYLTLPGEKGPETDEMSKIWLHITYRDIAKILGSLMKMELNPYTKYLLSDYLKNLGELISLSEFKEFGEKVKLYFEYYPDISELEEAWNEELKLFLKSLRKKLASEKQNWPEPDSWEIENEGQATSVYKNSWYPEERKGMSFYFYPSRSKQGFVLGVYVESDARTLKPKFIKLWEKRFGKQEKSIGRGNFRLYRGEAYLLECLIKIDFGKGEKFVDNVAKTFTEAVELFSGLIDKVMLEA